MTKSGDSSTSPLFSGRLGFLGAGKMASALAGGFLARGIVTKNQLIACDLSAEAREAFERQTGVPATDNIEAVAKASEILILAVKPQSMPGLLGMLSQTLKENPLIISIAAGIPLSMYSRNLGTHRRLVRVMPNTPCLVGASASGYSLGGEATVEDGKLVQELFSAVGIACEVPEALLDTVTGLSGSGPAFVYTIIEALSDGGVRMGLPRNISTRLAAQTLLGAAKMVLETGEHPGALKDAVTSPGGTTIAGIQALENGGLRGCLMNAVEAATLRARELGQM